MVQQLSHELDELMEDIIIHQKVAGPHALEQAEAKLRDAEQQYTELTLPGAYERHLLQFMKEQRDLYQEDEREDPLCSCSNPYCALKTGELPSMVRQAETLDAGLTAFLIEHDGDAAILKEGRQVWVSDASECKSTLREALIILRRDERPDEETETAEASA